MAVVKQFAREQREKYPADLTRSILFGSYAKGVAGPASDFDILMVLRKKNHELVNAIYDDAYDLLLEHGIDISLKIYAEQDFAKKMSMGTPFMEEIKRTGVDL